MIFDFMPYSYKSKKALKYFDHVNPDLWKDYVKIIEINRFRHYPDWGEGKSPITFCNYCGWSFCYGIKEELKEKYGKVSQCANTGCKLIDCDIELYEQHIKIKHEILFRKFS